MRTLFLFMLCLLLSFTGPETSTSGHGPSSGIADDPLRWDDLVVRGVVKGVAYETIPAED